MCGPVKYDITKSVQMCNVCMCVCVIVYNIYNI